MRRGPGIRSWLPGRERIAPRHWQRTDSLAVLVVGVGPGETRRRDLQSTLPLPAGTEVSDLLAVEREARAGVGRDVVVWGCGA